jgi:iron complex outermembrane receptor protein
LAKAVRRIRLFAASSLTCAAIALPGIAIAQASAPAQASAAPQDSAAPQVDTIVVTGSRIARPLTDTPNPVVMVTSQQIVQSGTTNLTEYLEKIPALQGSIDSFSDSGSRAPIGFTGLNLLNLRNLGFDRTLVLIDGRRQVGAADGLQAVDINTIPEDLISRVDVLTGGASAIYGADAVSGVVNFVMKHDFEGLNLRLQNGISSHGDAGQRLVSLTIGHNFAGGRGNIAVAWEHSEEDRLDQHARKQFDGSNQVGFFKNPNDGLPDTNSGVPSRIPLNDVRYFDTSRQGGIDVDFDGFPDFYGAQGLPFDPGRFVPDFYQQGGSGTLISDYGNDLLPRVHRDLINGFAHFDISPALTIYAEGKYARTRSYTLGQPTFDYYLFIPEDNPFIPASVRPHIDPENGGVLVNRDNFDFGQRGEDVTRETIRTVIGARGEIAPNLNYDISYVYGRSKITDHYINNRLTDRWTWGSSIPESRTVKLPAGSISTLRRLWRPRSNRANAFRSTCSGRT